MSWKKTCAIAAAAAGAGAILVVLVLLLAGRQPGTMASVSSAALTADSAATTSQGVESASAVPNADALTNTIKASASQGGPQESVQVHGAWTIEVRESSGQLVSRREFENALTWGGTRYLAQVLSRSIYVGTWGILLSNPGGTEPCVSGGSPAWCIITESNPGPGISGWPNTSFFNTLTLSTDPADIGGTVLVLQGTATAQANGGISQVISLSCFTYPGDSDPSTCNNGMDFTSATLPAPVSVTTGQQILVTVRISFS